MLGLAFVGGFAGMFVPHPTNAFADAVAPLVPVNPAHEKKNWKAYGNISGASRFVALNQITRDNVHRPKVVWS